MSVRTACARSHREEHPLLGCSHGLAILKRIALTALQFLKEFLKEEAPHFPFAPPSNYVAGGMKGKVFGDADSRSLLPGEHSAP